MHTENKVTFSDELMNRTGFYLWMHSNKCKYIRIGFYIAMLICAVLAVVGILRKLIIKTDWSMALVFAGLTLVLLFVIMIIWPLVFRSRAISAIHPEIPQIITMDEKSINLHTSIAHQSYKWRSFTDLHEDESYYFLFSPEVYIILDKSTFPKGGEEIFKSFRTPARLIKEFHRKPARSRYLMITTNDYLTPIAKMLGISK